MTDDEIIAALEGIDRPVRRLLGASLMSKKAGSGSTVQAILRLYSDSPAASDIAALTELLDHDPDARNRVARIIDDIDPVARYYRDQAARRS